ncbi:unnamed protein product, partial [Allacma fusca]
GLKFQEACLRNENNIRISVQSLSTSYNILTSTRYTDF